MKGEFQHWLGHIHTHHRLELLELLLSQLKNSLSTFFRNRGGGGKTRQMSAFFFVLNPSLSVIYNVHIYIQLGSERAFSRHYPNVVRSGATSTLLREILWETKVRRRKQASWVILVPTGRGSLECLICVKYVEIDSKRSRLMLT